MIKKISKEYDLKSAKYIEPWPYIVFNLLAVDKPLTNMIHATMIQQRFPENAKITRGTPIYKNTKDGSNDFNTFIFAKSVDLFCQYLFNDIYEEIVKNIDNLKI